MKIENLKTSSSGSKLLFACIVRDEEIENLMKIRCELRYQRRLLLFPERMVDTNFLHHSKEYIANFNRVVFWLQRYLKMSA